MPAKCHQGAGPGGNTDSVQPGGVARHGVELFVGQVGGDVTHDAGVAVVLALLAAPGTQAGGNVIGVLAAQTGVLSRNLAAAFPLPVGEWHAVQAAMPRSRMPAR